MEVPLEWPSDALCDESPEVVIMTRVSDHLEATDVKSIYGLQHLSLSLRAFERIQHL